MIKNVDRVDCECFLRIWGFGFLVGYILFSYEGVFIVEVGSVREMLGGFFLVRGVGFVNLKYSL